MKIILKRAQPAAFVLSLFAAAATAQEVTVFPGESAYGYLGAVNAVRMPAGGMLAPALVTGRRSELTRDAVLADLARARADGSFDRSGEVTFVAHAPRISTLTRADVVLAAARARADGTLDTSGEVRVARERWGGIGTNISATLALLGAILGIR